MENLQKILEGHDYCCTDLVFRLNSYIAENLSPHRYKHCLEVARISLELALRNNFSGKKIQKLIIAALAHDITKEKPGKFHREIFAKYKVKEYSKLPHTLYHSKSAAYFIQEQFKITNQKIIHAISYHSTGCKKMSDFSRIIYCADYLGSFQEPPDKNKYNESLNKLCLEKNISTLQYLLSKKMPVQSDSINFYNVLISEDSHGKKGTKL